MSRESDLLELITDCETVAINKWLVQVIRRNKWHTAYFAIPPNGGVPNPLYGSRMEALLACLDSIEKEE